MIRLIYAVLLGLVLAQPALAQLRAQVTDDVDRFVLDLFDRIQPKSIAENREYCGVIGFDGNGNLAASEPERGQVDSCDSIDPVGWEEIIATYHTHGGYLADRDSEVPSVDDLQGDIREKVDGYVATPGGRVWLNLYDEKLTFQLCGRGCVKNDPKFRRCASMIPRVEYTLSQLRARVDQDSGDC